MEENKMEEYTIQVTDGDTGEFVGVLIFHAPLPKYLMLENLYDGNEVAYEKEDK